MTAGSLAGFALALGEGYGVAACVVVVGGSCGIVGCCPPCRLAERTDSAGRLAGGPSV